MLVEPLRSPNKECNQEPAASVITHGVDALSNTWLSLTQARWSKPRLRMTIPQLGNWFADSIRLWRKWSGPIGRDELLKRIFVR